MKNRYCSIFPITFFITCSLSLSQLSAQLGGQHIYGFLSQAPSARQAALGNGGMAYGYENSSLIFVNPALVSNNHNYSVSAQHQFQFSGVGNGSVSYVQSMIDSSWTFGVGVQYTDFGTFQGYDEYEINRGEFSALDASLQFSASKQLGPRLHLGTSVKFINSSYENYSSFGMGVDIGAYYYIAEKQLGLAFVMKNLAFQLSSYEEKEQLMPVDFQIGVSKRLEHLPLRFQINYHHLNKWKLINEEENQTDNGFGFGETQQSGLDKFANDFFMHIVFSAELGIGKNEPVYLRLSYNHQKGQALSVDYYRAFTGIGMGVGINIKSVKFDYGYTIAHLAGGMHSLGLSYQFGQTKRKNSLRE